MPKLNLAPLREVWRKRDNSQEAFSSQSAQRFWLLQGSICSPVSRHALHIMLLYHFKLNIEPLHLKQCIISMQIRVIDCVLTLTQAARRLLQPHRIMGTPIMLCCSAAGLPVMSSCMLHQTRCSSASRCDNASHFVRPCIILCLCTSQACWQTALLRQLNLQAARPAVLRVKAGQPFLKVVGAPPAAPGIMVHAVMHQNIKMHPTRQAMSWACCLSCNTLPWLCCREHGPGSFSQGSCHQCN